MDDRYCAKGGSLRGQASLENILVLSLGLAAISIIVYVAAMYLADALMASQAADAAARIGAAADYVYSVGPNSKEYVDVYLPDGIRNVTISGRRLVISIATSAGVNDFSANTRANLTGSLPSGRGKQRVLVQYIEPAPSAGFVLIGQTGFSCGIANSSESGVTSIYNISPAQKNSYRIILNNTAGVQITGMESTFLGSANSSGAASAERLVNFTLGAGNTRNISLNTTNSGLLPGAYTGSYLVQAGNAGACTVSVNVYVNANDSCNSLCFVAGYDSSECSGSVSSCTSHNGEVYPIPADCGAKTCCCMPKKADSAGPAATGWSISPIPPRNSTAATITAFCDDALSGGSNIAGADFRKNGNSTWVSGNVQSPGANKRVGIGVDYAAGILPLGYNTIWARCTDSAGYTGSAAKYTFYVGS